MIEVVIKAVKPSAQYEGLIYSYIVTCILNNNREIDVFDEKPFELTKKINKKIKIQLSTFFLNEKRNSRYLFVGTIKYFDLSDEYYFVGDEINVFIPKETLKLSDVKINKRKEYGFDEFILKNIFL